MTFFVLASMVILFHFPQVLMIKSKAKKCDYIYWQSLSIANEMIKKWKGQSNKWQDVCINTLTHTHIQTHTAGYYTEDEILSF